MHEAKPNIFVIVPPMSKHGGESGETRSNTRRGLHDRGLL
jgi:hypothetical protein